MAQKKHYHQLSFEERDHLALCRAQGLSLGEIAKRLHRNKGTISRELSRNGGQIYDRYGACKAEHRARDRKRRAGERPRLKTNFLRSFVKRHLRKGWSPEQIVGQLRRKYPGRSVCVESIYRFVYDGRVRRQENFVPYLVRAHKRRLQRGHRHTHRDLHIPERISILQRPRVVDQRRQFGHWESDTVIARRSQAALSVTVERVSLFTKIAKLPRRTAKHLRIALARSLSQYPRSARRSITYDNGQENVEHMCINKILGTRSYFCEPFHSWEKALVENTIGIIRRTYPKKTNFDHVTNADVKRLERQLNNRPRKTLNYRTPREVFNLRVALPH
ncbi:MAG: IS30 family transposase [Bacteroidota bacterium]